MSHNCQAKVVYGIPLSNEDLSVWEQKHGEDFDPMPIHGCEHIIHGDMDVKAFSAIGVSVSKSRIYAGEVRDLDLQREIEWDTDLYHVCLDLELPWLKPRWMLLCCCG
jgi:hypothetical protein